MSYTAKSFEHIIGIPGLSEKLLRDHITLYEGYVKNVNTIAELAKTMEPGTPQSSEVRRRFGWEWDGMRLHELYFGNLTKEDVERSVAPELVKAIEGAFGSFDAWKTDIEKAAMMRGIGWVMLAKDTETGALFTIWVNEHDGGHLVGTTPIIVLDVFEHAYMTDYGLKRADYVDVALHAIDWRVAEERFVTSC
ncbi:MAG: superoxide dismutase [Candidatus Yonathbacteria bacterium]|nr:superoxide dismutase [Candidatus Yonathbacteria bacterium]